MFVSTHLPLDINLLCKKILEFHVYLSILYTLKASYQQFVSRNDYLNINQITVYAIYIKKCV